MFSGRYIVDHQYDLILSESFINKTSDYFVSMLPVVNQEYDLFVKFKITFQLPC